MSYTEGKISTDFLSMYFHGISYTYTLMKLGDE